MRKGRLLILALCFASAAFGQIHWLNSIESPYCQPRPVFVGFVCGMRGTMTDGLSANLTNRPRASVPKDLLTTLENDREPGPGVCGVNPVVVNTPAMPPPAIRLRCGGAIFRTHPLLIVDGEIKDSSTLATIDPNSIASIEILKDAPATALYGSAGSAGVILITTKKIESAPIQCAEPMEEVVIRTTACYRRTVCSYQVSSSISKCTMTLSMSKKENRNEQVSSRPNTSGGLFPNPAPVGGPINWTSTQGAKELQVFTASGQWIRSLNISGQQRGQIQLNGLPAGLYLLRFMGEKNTILQTERFILQ